MDEQAVGWSGNQSDARAKKTRVLSALASIALWALGYSVWRSVHVAAAADSIKWSLALALFAAGMLPWGMWARSARGALAWAFCCVLLMGLGALLPFALG